MYVHMYVRMYTRIRVCLYVCTYVHTYVRMNVCMYVRMHVWLLASNYKPTIRCRVNRLRNNIFVNTPPLPLLCEISGALHLAQPSLTVGWQAGRLADEIEVNFKIFKVGCRSKYSTCRFV